MKTRLKWFIVAILVAGGAGWFIWQQASTSDMPEGIARGNGRLEAVDIDVAAKTGGRIEAVFPREGDFVVAGETLARMDTAELEAQKTEAQAQQRRAEIAIETAESIVEQRNAELDAAQANVDVRQAELDAAAARLERSEQLAARETISRQVLDDDRSAERRANAALASARASVAAAKAAITSARAQVVDAEAAVTAAKASVARIDVQIADATLVAPRDGRVQYRLAEPGEVIGSGGRVINMIDVSDVYMNIFLPTAEAGRVALGSEVRLIMDAAPDIVIPATVSFVSDTAQFTPRTVETEEERLKLAFRVRARIAPELLEQYMTQVKTGLPGMAYVKLAPDAEWPDFLQQNLIQ